MTAIRQMPMFSIRADVAVSSDTADKRTVDLVWSTGARVKRTDWMTGDSYQEELSMDPAHVRMDRLRAGAPFLDSHVSYNTRGVVGVVESANIADGKGTATVRFPAAGIDSNADRVFALMKDGILRNISVGYRVHKFQRIETGDKKTDLPIMRAVDWEPHEISTVPIPADAGAQVMRSGSADLFPCEILEREQETMADEINTPATQDDAARAAALREAGAVAERARIAEIERAGAQLGLSAEFVATHKGGSTSIEDFRKLAIEERAKLNEPAVGGAGGSGGGIEVGEGSREKFARCAADWILVRTGKAQLIEAAAKRLGKTAPALDPGVARGMSLFDIGREFLDMAGVKYRGMDRMQIAGLMFAKRDVSGAGLQNPGDFSTVLENVMSKTLLGAYQVQPDTWRGFCKVGFNTDFRPSNRYRLGAIGVLKSLTANGEYEHVAIPDGEKQVATVGTKGAIVGVTRKTIVNDDMGAVLSMLESFGTSASLTIETDVYALLALNGGLGPDMADTNPFFDASHNNVGTGATLSVASIDADAAVLAAQTEPNTGRPLDTAPFALLVPRGLRGNANTINDAQYDVDSNAALLKPNRVRGFFTNVIGTARLTGTRRYLFANPALMAAFEVTFLEGGEAPVLETKQGWDYDGVEYRCRHDFGVNPLDVRAAVTNAGTT